MPEIAKAYDVINSRVAFSLFLLRLLKGIVTHRSGWLSYLTNTDGMVKIGERKCRINKILDYVPRRKHRVFRMYSKFVAYVAMYTNVKSLIRVIFLYLVCL